ncbi:MMPL family transporter [Geotalea sp. SG265]|uniref:efflux RND transporter permease subunit n=1 Tax=Geotalea sp. SG265 TaxID=2922867 RepID=UPI001FAF0F3B|nr:MMPL family transporter [Geotalea sp. SG265]
MLHYRIKKLSSAIVSTSNSLIRKHLEWIYTVTTTKPALVFVVCCLVFLLSCLSITRIHFESDIFKLFPQKGPLALFLDTIKWTGSAGNTYILLEGEDKGKLTREAELFAGKMQSLSIDGAPAFTKVKFRVFDPAEAKPFADFISYAVTRPQLFVAPADVSRYQQLLSPESVDSSLRRAKTELATPGSLSEMVACDPLYLRDLILPRLKTASEALDLDKTSPYFLSRDGKVLIIIAEPARPVTDIAFARKLVAAINEARKGATVKISFAGAHLSAVTDEKVLKENVIVGVLSSLIIVLALFYVAYRRFLPTLLIPFILVYGVVLAIGTGGLLFPTISIISFAFTSLIIGLGTDYSIHLYDRFHFERSNGKSADEALRLATVDTGHALFTAASTTAFPFLALVLSDVRVLSELGFLVGLGVIYSLYATFFFLPPLLLFMEKKYPLKAYKPLPSFGLGWLWKMGQRYWRGDIALSSAAMLCLLLAATGTSFESELKNLQPRNSEAFLTQEKVERHLSVSPKQLIVAVEGNDLDDVLKQGRKVNLLAQEVQQRGEIVSYSSLGLVMNGEGDQLKVAGKLAERLGSAHVGIAVNSALAREGFATEPFQEYVLRLDNLTKAQTVPPKEGIDRLLRSPLHGIVERHLIQNGNGYHLLTYLNYRGSEFQQAPFLKKLKEQVPTSRAASVDLVSGQLSESVRQTFLLAVIIGSVMVLFLLISHFNTPTGILYSLFPVASGTIAMLGVMALCGMRLNFMNVMVLVTVLGMGSDYGLHIAHRVRNCNEEEYQGRFIQSGRAVLLSGLTTIAGFGSLAFTDYGALASIGWATNFGVAATTLFTLATLPAFMHFFGRSRRADDLP